MKLGKHQIAVLGALQVHGNYSPCGCWTYKNESTVIRILESLVKRGLVREVQGFYVLTDGQTKGR